MDSEVQIRPLRDGLMIRSRRGRKNTMGFLLALVVLLISGSILSSSFGLMMRVLIGAIFALFILLLMTSATYDSRLQVTKFEFASTYTRPAAKRARRVTIALNTADVRWLEYRTDERFGLSGAQASGLYAVKSIGAECLLPFLDLEQTASVIRAIESSFPGLAEMWRNNQRMEHNTGS